MQQKVSGIFAVQTRIGKVGGHCIGVDPYYLTYKADSIGYTKQRSYCAGRELYDKMGEHVASQLVSTTMKKKILKLKILEF